MDVSAEKGPGEEDNTLWQKWVCGGHRELGRFWRIAPPSVPPPLALAVEFNDFGRALLFNFRIGTILESYFPKRVPR